MFDINEVSSPGAAAAVVLERTDPTTLSDLDLVGYAQAAERQVAHATAMSLQASLVLAERAEARARGELAEGSGCQGIRPAHAEVLAERAGIAEVQQALRLSMNAAGSRLHRARALAGPLARTGAALTSGVINFGHVLVLLDHTDGLPEALIERMQARCLPRAGVQTPGNFGKSLTRALHALDPQGSAQAHRTARTGAGVRVSQGRDGMSALIITATSPDAAWGYTIVDTLARAELHRRHRASTETDETAGNGVLRTPSDVSDPGQDGNGVLGTPSEACGIEDPAGNGVLRTPSEACGIEDPDRNGVLGAPGCPHRLPSLDQLRSQVFLDLLARAVHDPGFPTEHGKRRIETQLVLTLPTLLGLREDPATINGQSVPAPECDSLIWPHLGWLCWLEVAPPST